MLSIVDVGPAVRELRTHSEPAPLLQVVDADLYALDVAAADLAAVLDDDRADACAIFGAFRDLQRAYEEAAGADRDELLLIADQLPVSEETADPTMLEALAETHAHIECELDRVRHDLWIARRFDGDVKALEQEEHQLLFARAELRPQARRIAAALARSILV